MARPLRIQFPGAFYHITCRGIEKRKIYQDDSDRRKFLSLLFESLETYQVILHAYALMSNHFHLLIQTPKANCSEFMRHFNICYTGWFNWRHRRCGNLYQGRYKAFLIDADSYLLEVSRYLHLNPVRIHKYDPVDWRRCWRDALTYRWSSLAGYVNQRNTLPDIDYDFILSIVGSRSAYRNFMLIGLKRGYDNPFKKVRSRIILGDDNFVKEVKRYLKTGSAREQPSYHDLISDTIDPQQLLDLLRKICNLDRDSLQRGRNGIVRGMVADLLYKYCSITQAQIGHLLGNIDYMSVSQLRRRLKAKLDKDAKLRKRFKKIESQLMKEL